MKILLANPPCKKDLSNGWESSFVRAGSRWPFSTIKKKGDVLEYLPFPFYLAYSAALLENSGFDVKVIDGVALDFTVKEFLAEVAVCCPEVIFFETATPTFTKDMQLAAEVKKILPNITVILGGPHVTTFGVQALTDNSVIDYAIANEYDFSLLSLVNSLVNKGDISNIHGLVFRDVSGQARANPYQPVDVAKLPFPARHLFPMAFYWDGFCQKKPAVQMHASRGCPFLCDFCLWSNVIYDRTRCFRPFPVSKIVDEMEQVITSYHAQEIYFDDDTITGNKKFFLDLCEEMIKREIPRRVSWSAMGDAMITDEEMVKKMAQAGGIGLKFGVESGNKRVLEGIGKPVDLERIKRVVSLLCQYKIKTHATFSFGLSGETRQSMQDTLDFAKSLDVDSVQFSISTPFPGTLYYEKAKEQGLLLDYDWSNFDGMSTSVVHFKNLQAQEVADFHCQALKRWLVRKLKQPRWVWRQLFYFSRAIRSRGLGIFWQKLSRATALILEH